MTKASKPVSRAAMARKPMKLFPLTAREKALTSGAVHAATIAFADVVAHVPLDGRARDAHTALAAAWLATSELGAIQDDAGPKAVRRATLAAEAARARCKQLEEDARAAEINSFSDLVALALFSVAADAMPKSSGALEWTGGSEGMLPIAILRLAAIDPASLFPEPARSAA